MTGPRRLVLLGHPVAHSLSPTFQNAALRMAGIPLVYEALDVRQEDLDTVAKELVVAEAAGNVTIPYKERFAVLCSETTPLAERVGAVNTFWTREGRLVGDNTDVGGFDRAARDLLQADPAGATVALLGAGGAAAAVLAAVERWDGSQTRVWSRTESRACALASRFAGAIAVSAVRDAVRGADLIVNATPVGMERDDIPVSADLLPRTTAVLDLVYRRGGTPWVRLALGRGLRASDGLPMLLEQGALAFERWFGIIPDRVAMHAAVPSA